MLMRGARGNASRGWWLALGLVLAAGRIGADGAPDERLVQVRKALGGDRLAQVSSLAIEGTFRRVMGERDVSGDLEFAVALPDKYLRTEIMGFDPANPVRRFTGFNGDTPLDSFSGGPNMVFRTGGRGPDGREVSPEEMQARQLRASRRDFGRLVAALLLASPASFPLVYAYAGEAESDDGRADVFDVTGPDEFSVKLLVDQATHLPVMLMYKEPLPRMQIFGGPGAQRPSREEMERRMAEARAAGPPPLVDAQLFLADYKKVDGVQFPHTVRRAVDGKTQEEWHIGSVKVNPSFKTDKFEKK
jgi:hypothetical protein